MAIYRKENIEHSPRGYRQQLAPVAPRLPKSGWTCGSPQWTPVDYTKWLSDS